MELVWIIHVMAGVMSAYCLWNVVRPQAAVRWTVQTTEWGMRALGIDADLRPTDKAPGRIRSIYAMQLVLILILWFGAVML